MTIRAVFFDAAGTLMQPARRVGESYALYAAKYGVQASAAEIAERFRLCFEDAPRLAFPGVTEDSIDALEREWWKMLVARVFEPWSPFEKFDEFFAELFAYFAEPGAWRLYPEALDTMAALQQRGLKLSVISNFDSRLIKILDGLGIGPCFERIFVSSRVGYAKPDREIFHAALRHHQVTPEHGLHVGDSPINDRLGAHNAGLRGVLVDRRSAADPSDANRINSLAAIVSLIE